MNLNDEDTATLPSSQGKPYQQPFAAPEQQTFEPRAHNVEPEMPSARFYDPDTSAQPSMAPVAKTRLPTQSEQIAQNHDVNDAFIDNIRAKLDMLDQI